MQQQQQEHAEHAEHTKRTIRFHDHNLHSSKSSNTMKALLEKSTSTTVCKTATARTWQKRKQKQNSLDHKLGPVPLCLFAFSRILASFPLIPFLFTFIRNLLGEDLQVLPVLHFIDDSEAQWGAIRHWLPLSFWFVPGLANPPAQGPPHSVTYAVYISTRRSVRAINAKKGTTTSTSPGPLPK
jgi:hypothetical protein